MITTAWSNSEAAIDVSGNVFDDSDYDRQCADIRNENAELIKEFSAWLADAGLSATTNRGHRDNLDLYLNHLLLRYNPLMRLFQRWPAARLSRSAARRARLIGTACSSAERACGTRVVGSTA